MLVGIGNFLGKGSPIRLDTVIESIVHPLGGAWWDMTQNATISDASAGADFAAWNVQNCTIASAGGVTTLTEDTTPSATHSIYKIPTNAVAGPISLAAVLQGKTDRMAAALAVA